MTVPTRIRTSAKAVVLHEGSVLLTRNIWNGGEGRFLPGGGQETGELLPDTVRREVREETGLTVRVGPLLWVLEGWIDDPGPLAAENHHRVEIVFLCTVVGSPELLGGTEEDVDQIGLDWVPLEKIASLENLSPRYRDHLPLLASGDIPRASYLERRGVSPSDLARPAPPGGSRDERRPSSGAPAGP
ncbi:NUDIX domain-containing protein [Streptomyces zaomyceticus]|uniref:NUDIX domain-containing protein n=1 Tax=Streptomyces zaomyceticus TaxID=68286 RepID=A0ABZ1LL15_9ACTN|nr:NUDIX domain-containing protein [Streptomyces zaomyceticus]